MVFQIRFTLHVGILVMSVFMFSAEAYVIGSTEKCDTIKVRKNIRSLTDAELKEYIQVLKMAYKDKVFDAMTDIHLKDFPATHHQPMFLLYHRYFAFDFEQRLQKYNSNISLPYWDETEDAEFPHKSVLFSSDLFGGNGDPNNSWCIRDSFLKDITIEFPICKMCVGCLRRQFNGKGDTIKPFTDAETVEGYIEKSATFDEFRFWIEDTLHFQVHDGIGTNSGDMGGPTSSNDPFFYLHHANMDRLHVKWAKRHPEVASFVNGLQEFYNDKRQVVSRSHYNNTTPISYYGMPAGSILETERPPLCYTYDDITRPKVRQI